LPLLLLLQCKSKATSPELNQSTQRVGMMYCVMREIGLRLRLAAGD